LKRKLWLLASEKNEGWSMDFISDQLFDGRRIRLLTIVDNHTRESLAIHVGQRIRGHEVVQVLEKAIKEHGKPQTIQVDNVQSSSLRMWIFGLIGIMSSWTSSARGNRQITPMSSRSTPASGWSA